MQSGEDRFTPHQGLRLRHIKSAISDNEVICLFVNDGDSALNLSVEVDGDIVGSIEPSDYVQNGQTGSIRLELPATAVLDDVLFSIRYKNERGDVSREPYVFDIRKGILHRHDEVAG